MGIGYWVLGIGYWILDIGYRISDIGLSVQRQGAERRHAVQAQGIAASLAVTAGAAPRSCLWQKPQVAVAAADPPLASNSASSASVPRPPFHDLMDLNDLAVNVTAISLGAADRLYIGTLVLICAPVPLTQWAWGQGEKSFLVFCFFVFCFLIFAFCFFFLLFVICYLLFVIFCFLFIFSAPIPFKP